MALPVKAYVTSPQADSAGWLWLSMAGVPHLVASTMLWSPFYCIDFTSHVYACEVHGAASVHALPNLPGFPLKYG
jgi:hypothetical protein